MCGKEEKHTLEQMLAFKKYGNRPVIKIQTNMKEI